MTMKRRALLVMAIMALTGVRAPAAPAPTTETYEAIKRMRVDEYQELGVFVRYEIMAPVAAREGVDYDALNACLIGSARHPVLREETLEQAVAGCAAWARGQGRVAN